jgi:hypothetical protein
MRTPIVLLNCAIEGWLSLDTAPTQPETRESGSV